MSNIDLANILTELNSINTKNKDLEEVADVAKNAVAAYIKAEITASELEEIAKNIRVSEILVENNIDARRKEVVAIAVLDTLRFLSKLV